MGLLGTGSSHLTGRYGKAAGYGSSTVGGNAFCQRCLQAGHWTYECKNEPAYKARPTRTQQLKNPDKNKPRFLHKSELLPEDLERQEAALAQQERKVTNNKRAAKGSSSSSDSGSTSGSSSSSETSSSDDSGSSGSDSSGSSTSRDSSSDSGSSGSSSATSGSSSDSDDSSSDSGSSRSSSSSDSDSGSSSSSSDSASDSGQSTPPSKRQRMDKTQLGAKLAHRNGRSGSWDNTLNGKGDVDGRRNRRSPHTRERQDVSEVVRGKDRRGVRAGRVGDSRYGDGGQDGDGAAQHRREAANREADDTEATHRSSHRVELERDRQLDSERKRHRNREAGSKQATEAPEEGHRQDERRHGNGKDGHQPRRHQGHKADTGRSGGHDQAAREREWYEERWEMNGGTLDHDRVESPRRR